MFERYTEKARRVIFFARYEASEFRSPFIDTEHLLLGVVREDEILRSRLLPGASHESLRKQIEALSLSPGIREPVPTTVDLPLSDKAQRALIYASQEAEALQHQLIDCGHLILGMLRVEGSLAAAFLGEQGITYEDYREVIRTSGMAAPGLPAGVRSHQERPSERPSAWDEEEESEPSTVSLRPSIDALKQLLDRAIEHLDTESPTYGRQRLKRKPWTRQEALGHLIDLATAHHQWFARALTETRLVVSAIPQDDWVPAQEYAQFRWPDMVDLWICLNRLLIHVLSVVPEEKVRMPCRLGIEEPISLLELVGRYIERSEDILEQLLSLL